MEQASARAPLEAKSTAIGGRFKGFQPEEERSSSKAEVQESSSIRQMKAAWRAWQYGTSPRYMGDILSIVGNLCYTIEDIEGFNIVLAEFQDEERFPEKAGHFLSALMNNGEDKVYTIRTRHLPVPLAFLGFQNEKDIIVDGDAGHYIGDDMRGGTIVVDGDASGWCGHRMRGGTITIKGSVGLFGGAWNFGGIIAVEEDAGDFVGSHMQGGIITVNGRAGDTIGHRMRRGQIRLEGDYGNLSDTIHGGRIYHKRKLIFPCD